MESFCDRSVREKAWRRLQACRAGDETLLAGGGRRARCSHTLAASQAFERLHMLFCHRVKTWSHDGTLDSAVFMLKLLKENIFQFIRPSVNLVRDAAGR